MSRRHTLHVLSNVGISAALAALLASGSARVSPTAALIVFLVNLTTLNVLDIYRMVARRDP